MPQDGRGHLRLRGGNIAVATGNSQNIVWHPAAVSADENGAPWYSLDQGAMWNVSTCNGSRAADIGGWTASTFQTRVAFWQTPVPRELFTSASGDQRHGRTP